MSKEHTGLGNQTGPRRDRSVAQGATQPDVEKKRQFEVAQARKELGILASSIAVAENQLQELREHRFKSMNWVETSEEREIRSRIELLNARSRNVRRWLARQTGQKPGRATKPKPDNAKNATPGKKGKKKKAKPKNGKAKASKKQTSASQADAQQPGRSKKKPKKTGRPKAKGKKSGSVLKGVSTGNRVKRVTLIG